MKEIKVRITFFEELLGTWPSNKEVAAEYIASKSPDAATIEDEINAIGVDGVVEKSMTVFPRDPDGNPILYDYQIKGFFKDSCAMLARVKTTESSKIKAYKKIIDGLVFVSPRMIKLDSSEIGNCQRPLRASTAQGERIALSNSETVPAGTTCEFAVTLWDDAHEKMLMEWLDYGKMRGIGQWRNSGKGRFEYEVIE